MNEENLGHYRTFLISPKKSFAFSTTRLNEEYAYLLFCLGQAQVVIWVCGVCFLVGKLPNNKPV